MAVALTPRQQEAAQANRLRVIVSAGAGSGKTRVLVERFVRLVREKQARVDEILTVTFTQRAAREMKERILQRLEEEGMGLERERLTEAPIGTIHSFCARLLREQPLKVPFPPDWRVADRVTLNQLAEQAVERELETALRGGDAATRALFETYGFPSILRGVAAAGEKLRSLGLEPQQLRGDGPFPSFLCRVWEAVEKEKRRLALLNHDDIQILARNLLRENPELLEKIRRRIQFIMIDEFQDTNPLQVELLEMLRREENDFCVGDKKQAIYGFRHAEVAAFEKREKEFAGGQECRLITLKENFRSRPEVIAFINRFFRALWEGDPSTPVADLVARATPRSDRPGGVEIALVDTSATEPALPIDEGRRAEALSIARRIERLTREEGYAYRDIAILFRSTTALAIYRQALQSAGLPHFLVSGRGFYAQQEIYDMANYLKVLAHPEQDLPLAGFLRSPFVGVSDEALYWSARAAKAASEKEPLWKAVSTIETVPQVSEEEKKQVRHALETLEELRRAAVRFDLPRLIEEGIGAFAYASKSLCFEDGVQRLANLQKLMRVAREYEQNFPRATLEEFCRYLDRLERGEEKEEEAPLEEEQGDVVRLMTLHQAKGLEFPVVILADLGRGDVYQTGDFRFGSDGRFALKTVDPLTLEKEPTPLFEELETEQRRKDWDEKKRLFYVGATRAEEKLILVGTTSFAERKKKNSETPFEAKPWAEWLRQVFRLATPEQNLPTGTTFQFILPSGTGRI